MSGIEISKRLVFANALSSILRKVLVAGVLVWVTQLYVRRLDPAELALLTLTGSLMVAFPLIPSMFAAGLRRYITDAYARGAVQEVTGIVSTMAPVLWVAAGATAVLGGICALFIEALLDLDPELVGKARLMFALTMLSMALRFAAAPFGLGFDLKQRFALRNAIGLGAEVFKTLLLIWLLSIRIDVLWIVVANTLATVIELAVTTVLSRRFVPALRIERGARRPGTLGKLVNFGGWSVVIQIALIVRDSADALILKHLANDVEVNNFGIGSKPDWHVRSTYIEATANAQPAMTAFNALGQQDRLRRAFFRLSRYSLWALVFVCLPLIVYREEAVRLYIREQAAVYTTIGTVMALLLARALVIFPNTLIGMIAAAKAEVRAVAWRSAVMSASNLLLTLYLVGALGMGAVGSALGTLSVTAIGAPLLNWSLAFRLTGTRWPEWLREVYLPGLVPLALAAPVWLGLWRWAPPQSWTALGLHFAAGWLVYLAALPLALRPEDRADLRALMARLGW
jgi:O-antigen/teichoic acid export membrane protein